MKTLQLLLVMFITTLCLPTQGHARRPRGTDLTGVVQSVNHSTREIVLVLADGKSRTFVYTPTAKFWHDGTNSPATGIQAGMRVRVSVHNPLVGPDFVRQVELAESK